MDAATQQTLTGDTAGPRELPTTLLYCETCDDLVLRSRRHDHPHDLTDAPDASESRIDELLEEFEISADTISDTQKYEVVFHYEYRERVVVEAANKSDAKEAAEHERDFSGEYVQTTHTSKRALDDPSVPTLDYLEFHGYLPEDHDLIPTDIQRVMDATDEN